MRTINTPFYWQAVLASLLLITCTRLVAAPVSALPVAEVERRTAAAGYVQAQELTLQMLRVECGTLMPAEAPRVEGIARAWYDRNKDDVISARVWMHQFLNHAKSVSAEQHQRASSAYLSTLSSAILSNAKTHFHRQPPTVEGCTDALRSYEDSGFDIKNIGTKKGYTQVGEFSKTLRKMRTAPDYIVPPEVETQFLSNVPFRPYASKEAAIAARDRGDWPMMRTIYTRLAEQGDGSAAHALGLSYLGSDTSSIDYLLAYRWFAAAWSVGNLEGLNALGVLLRDGIGVKVNPGLAYGAFLIAQQGAVGQSAIERTQRNVQSLQDKVTASDRTALACMSIASFDKALQTTETAQALVPAQPLVQGERKLGQIVSLLAGELAACR